MHKGIKYYLLIFCCILAFYNINAQNTTSDSLMNKVEKISYQLFYRDFDTTFIKSYDNKINVHLLAGNKYSFFQVRDGINQSQLYYRPQLGLTFGAGISHKWFSFDLSFSSWINEETELLNSDMLDFQGRLFSGKQYIEATLQYYYGYKLSSISSYYDNIQSDFKAREDMRSIHINLQYLFAFNYTKFSIKAPYVFNQVQEKSAGSPVAGAAFTLYVVDADSTIVPNNIESEFEAELHLRDFNNIGISVNFGYMYTFVVKKSFYYNIGFIPGLDLNKGDYYTDKRNRMSPNFSFRARFMNALGYSGPKYYAGTYFIGNAFSARIDRKLKANIGYTKVGIVLGYRF